MASPHETTRPSFRKGFFPILVFLVATSIHESLKLSVGDFILIDPVSWQPDGSNCSNPGIRIETGDPCCALDHAGRKARFRIQ